MPAVRAPSRRRGKNLTRESTLQPRPDPPRKTIVAATVCGSLLLALAAAEVLLRVFAPAPDPYAHFKTTREVKPIVHEFPPNFTFESRVEPGLPGMPPAHRRFSTNNVGFRGDFLARPKPPREYRIFMVGGSTTECLYLDDSEAITFVLQHELRRERRDGRDYRVYGAGQSGNVSSDHVAMISQRIVHLEPDMIIVFAGINDLTASIYGKDYTFLQESETRRYSFLNLLSFVATEFQLPRYGYTLRKRLFKKSSREILEEIPAQSNYRVEIELRKSLPMARGRPRTDLRSYEENLRTILGIARAHRIALVFVTQASTWNSRVDPRAVEWHWMTHRRDVVYREEWMDEALESYNDVMRRLGRENGTPVFDLARKLEKSLEFLYDDCHFNVAGARRAGQELGSFLSGQLLAPAGASAN